MKYNGKEYSDNEILEILNTKDEEIRTSKELLDGANTKIKQFEETTKELNSTIDTLKVKNYDLLTKVNIGVPSEPNKEPEPNLISIEDLY